jgi:hypothetical protein
MIFIDPLAFNPRACPSREIEEVFSRVIDGNDLIVEDLEERVN